MSKRTLWVLAGAASLNALVLLIRGGGSTQSAAYASYKKDAPAKALAVIVNNPDQTLAAGAEESYVADSGGEKLLIIPRYVGSTVSLEPVRLEGEELVALPAVFSTGKTPDGWSLLLTALRPEGMPMWRISVSGPKGAGTYVISYNGKTGTPPVEYIMEQ
jgi:hypothetical protein